MNIGFNKGFFFFGAKEPLEVIFSPKKGKKKKEEVIFKFKKFSSVLCHLRYSRRKRENEHVYIYIYIYMVLKYLAALWKISHNLETKGKKFTIQPLFTCHYSPIIIHP